jgi:GT2 family glycosyltransferase
MRAGVKSPWAGALEGADAGLLYGWCVDTRTPDARVVLEVLHEGEVIGSVVADVARQDLQAAFAKLGAADPCHGFVADIGRYASLPQPVRMRIANSDAYLDGFARVNERPPRDATSGVFSDGGLRVHGRLGADARLQTVRAFVGSAEVARTVVESSEDGGFVLDLPPKLADGQVHEVRVVDGKGKPLSGSPVTVCCWLQGGGALLDAGQKKIATQLFEQYERFVPRSLGLAFYPEWKQAFETTASRTSAKVGVIRAELTGDALARALQDCVRRRVEFITFVREGDEMPATAHALLAGAFADKRTLAAYADSEFRGVPWFKPAWNLEYAIASDSALFPLMLRTVTVAKAGVADGETTWQLMWRALARAHLAGAAAIRHVPHVLYTMNTPPSPQELAQRASAAQAALRLIEPTSTLESSAFLSPDAQFQPRRLRSTADRKQPVTLVIPTRDRVELLERCIASIRRHTHWPNLELLVVDNDSAELATRDYLRAIARQGVRVLPHPGPFNFAAMNNEAVHAARGSIVGLINNDIEATHGGWLDEIVGQLMRPGVGVVGAKLLWPNGMVQHGGVVLGMGNGASHFGNRLADGDWGDHGRNQLLQQASAVTAACLFIRRDDWLAVGGMDAHAFPVNFNDVDLCLKMRARGQAVVWTPHACLLHAESASRGKDEAPSLRARVAREIANLRTRWGHVLLKDPAYHPSLNLDPHSHPFGGLAIPPRDRSPRLGSITE